MITAENRDYIVQQATEENPIFYDIIIPNWNCSEKAIACIESIKKYTKNYRLIFVDNGSREEEFNAINKHLKDIPHLKIFRNTENEGFVKAVNKGLRVSNAPFVIIQNNDTEVTEGWVEKLERSPFHIAGPVTSPNLSWQSCDRLRLIYKEIPAFDGNTDDYAKKLGEAMDGKYTDAKAMVAFFSTLIRREVIEKVGLLSEEFGLGFGDDDDYCARARKEGFTVGAALDCFVFHHHRTTFKQLFTNQQIKDMQDKNLEIYYNKKDMGLYDKNGPESVDMFPNFASQMTPDQVSAKVKELAGSLRKNQTVTTKFIDVEAIMNKYMQSYDERYIPLLDGNAKISKRRFEAIIRGSGQFNIGIKEVSEFVLQYTIIKL